MFYCKTKQINIFYDMNHYAGLVYGSNVVNHILISKHYVAAKFGEYKLTESISLLNAGNHAYYLGPIKP